MKITGNYDIDGSTAEWVVGSDEAGTGAWAGPFVVAGTALPRAWVDPEVDDSKALTPKQRRRAFEKWTIEAPVIWEAVVVSPEDLDNVGMGNALTLAHRTVLNKLLARITGTSLIVVDGVLERQIGVPGLIGVIGGDALIPAISLGSVIAKVSRDELMVRYDEMYPGYAFASNKGYNSKAHEAGLDRLGVCPIHRKSYSPIAKRLKIASTIPV